MDSRPWTESRCSRLLRPLITGLASLNEERTEESQPRIHRASKHKKEQGFLKGAPTDALWSRFRSKNEHGEELDYAGIYSRKRVKRTYGDRGMRTRSLPAAKEIQVPTEGSNGDHGEILVSTPDLGRKRSGHLVNTSPSTDSKNVADDLNCSNRENFENLGCKIKKMNRIEAVTASLLSVLKQTQMTGSETAAGRVQIGCSHEPQSIGASSLFSLCLQTVPAHIVDEQAWRKIQDKEDKSDASVDVYQFLESLGTRHGQGWKPLQAVVRAHSISLIQTAVEKKSLSAGRIHALVKICIRYGSLGESRNLIRAWALAHDGSRFPLTPSAARLELQDVLNMWSRKSKTSAFQYHLLIDMMKNQTLPIEWITTSAFKSLWHKVIASISQQDKDSEAAVIFITEVLSLVVDPAINSAAEEDDLRHDGLQSSSSVSYSSCQCRDGTFSCVPRQSALFQEALANTISSLCTILCAMAFIRKASESIEGWESTCESLTRPIHLAAMYLEHRVLAPSENLNSHALAKRVLICGADVLITCHDLHESINTSTEALDRSVSRLVSICDSYDRVNGQKVASIGILSQFFCSVVRCYGRVQVDFAFDLLSRIVHSMLDYRSTCDDGLGNAREVFMRRLALDTVMSSTETANSPCHIQLAYDAEKLVGDLNKGERWRKSAKQCPNSPQIPSYGLRWEEGICEWVAATPATMLKRKTSELSSQNSPPRSPISFIHTSANNLANPIEPQIPTILNIHTISNKESEELPEFNALEDEELIDSGVFFVDASRKLESSRQNRKIYLEPLQPGTMPGPRDHNTDTEDELVSNNLIRSVSSSCGLKEDPEVANKLMSRRAAQKQIVQDGLDSWDLTSDELG